MSLLPPSDSHLRRSTHLPWISSVHGCSSFSLAFHPIHRSVHPISNGLHTFTGGLHTHHHHCNVAPPNPNPKEKKLPPATSSLDPGDLPERISHVHANIRRQVCGEGLHPVRFASLPLLTFRLTRTSRGCVARIDPLLPNPPFFAPFARIPGWGKHGSTRSKRAHKKGLGRRFGPHPDPVQPSPTQTRQVETRQTSASHRFETFRFGFERCSASLQGTPAAFGPEGGAGGGLVGRTGPPTSPATVAPLVQLDTDTKKKNMGANQSGLDTNLGSRRSRRSFRGLGSTYGAPVAPLETIAGNRTPTRVVRPLRPLDTCREMRHPDAESGEKPQEVPTLLSRTVEVRGLGERKGREYN